MHGTVQYSKQTKYYLITINAGPRHQPPQELDIVGSLCIILKNKVIGSCLYVLPHCICLFRCSVRFLPIFRSLHLNHECVQNISRKMRLYHTCTHTYIMFLEHSSWMFCTLNMREKRRLETPGYDHPVSQRRIPEQAELFFLGGGNWPVLLLAR